MSRYTVVYHASAEQDLVAVWDEAADRRYVTSAADRADEILASSPQKASVYLKEDLWRLEVIPLRFYFTILEDDRIVKVSNVNRIEE